MENICNVSHFERNVNEIECGRSNRLSNEKSKAITETTKLNHDLRINEEELRELAQTTGLKRIKYVPNKHGKCVLIGYD